MTEHQGNLEKVQVFIVCGVCGCGKTTIAERISKHFNSEFIEGDDLHPIENKEMMKKGQPLDDVHRFPWLKEIAKTIKLKNENLISSKRVEKRFFASCSALKRIYREMIEKNLGENYEVIWIYLKIDNKEQLKERMRSRKGHFMNENLVQSQFDALEIPNSNFENVIELKVETKSIEEIVDELISSINRL